MNTSSRRNRWIVGSVVLILLLCVGLMAITLSIRGGNDVEAAVSDSMSVSDTAKGASAAGSAEEVAESDEAANPNEPVPTPTLAPTPVPVVVEEAASVEADVPVEETVAEVAAAENEAGEPEAPVQAVEEEVSEPVEDLVTVEMTALEYAMSFVFGPEDVAIEDQRIYVAQSEEDNDIWVQAVDVGGTIFLTQSGVYTVTHSEVKEAYAAYYATGAPAIPGLHPFDATMPAPPHYQLFNGNELALWGQPFLTNPDLMSGSFTRTYIWNFDNAEGPLEFSWFYGTFPYYNSALNADVVHSSFQQQLYSYDPFREIPEQWDVLGFWGPEGALVTVTYIYANGEEETCTGQSVELVEQVVMEFSIVEDSDADYSQVWAVGGADFDRGDEAPECRPTMLYEAWEAIDGTSRSGAMLNEDGEVMYRPYGPLYYEYPDYP